MKILESLRDLDIHSNSGYTEYRDINYKFIDNYLGKNASVTNNDKKKKRDEDRCL